METIVTYAADCEHLVIREGNVCGCCGKALGTYGLIVRASA